jgi:hypothetical protein
MISGAHVIVYSKNAEADRAFSKASFCFMGGNPMVKGTEPGKQKTRRCRAQELFRSSAQESERQKKSGLLYPATMGIRNQTLLSATRKTD